MKPSDFTVGQEVWVARMIRRADTPLETAKVTKIGRKWVCIGEGWSASRFDPEDMRLDGGQYTSPGSVWLSPEAFESAREARAGWTAFARRISMHSHPQGITLAKVREIAALCDIDLDAAMKEDAR